MAFNAGSFFIGFIIGGLAGAWFVGTNAIKLGVAAVDVASKEGWLNKREIEKDMARAKAKSAYVRLT